MFGEDDIALTRASSPWDSILASSPSQAGSLDNKHANTGIPRLAPEVEEGNVEYKLKLTNITDARFARLVTQLKWRLLEGNGQAYYELGVADSGALIGLPRSDLEESLETLDMMAGEIGASVIIVKEIEVPPAIIALAEISDYIDPETGEWTEKMMNKKARRLAYDANADSGLDAYDFSENEMDTSMIECTDTDDPSPTVATPPDVDASLGSVLTTHVDRLMTSNPDIPAAQSSPCIAPLDDDLAFFSMEPEPDFVIQGDVPPTPALDEPVSDISLDIEIASVFKRRPLRRRPPPPAAGSMRRRGFKVKGGKKPQPWRSTTSNPTADTAYSPSDTVPDKQGVKALQRRLARDKRREAKRNGQASLVDSGSGLHALISVEVATPSRAAGPSVVTKEAEVEELAAGLDELPVDVQTAEASAAPDATELAKAFPARLAGVGVDNEVHAVPQISVKVLREPRLIVEALVVRKLSIDEAFLDFGGF